MHSSKVATGSSIQARKDILNGYLPDQLADLAAWPDGTPARKKPNRKANSVVVKRAVEAKAKSVIREAAKAAKRPRLS